MLRKKIRIMTCVAFAVMLMSSCSAGPLDKSEIVGEWDGFTCSDNNLIEGDWDRYVSISWEITDAKGRIVEINYTVTEDQIAAYEEDHKDELDGIQPTEQDVINGVSEMYDMPAEGKYKYDRSDKKLVHCDQDIKYNQLGIVSHP